MNDLRDPDVVASLRPRDVASYLRAHGWSTFDEEPGRFTLWHRAADGNGGVDDAELLVPLSRDLRDYALRVGEVLDALAELEERSRASVFADVRHSTSDIIRVRRSGEAGGELPIDEGTQLVQSSRDLLLAAACAAVQRRPVFHTRKPAQAVEYMEHVRLGQTERGSFVVTLVSDLPFAAQATLNEGFEPDQPFARRATRTLHTALSAASAAAQVAVASGELGQFEEAVESGVSANLCDALAATTAQGARGHLDVGFSWAISRPAQGEVRAIRFSSDEIEVLEEAAKSLKRHGPFEDETIFGTVERLHRVEGEEHGTATVAALVFDKPARVRLDLDARQYDKAIRAHQSQRLVACTGTLDREGRQWVLRAEGPLVVVEPGDADPDDLV